MRYRLNVTRTFVVVAIVLGAVLWLPGPIAEGQDDEGRLKQQISAALQPNWRVTGMKAVDPAAPPWSDTVGGNSGGYVALCENPTELTEQPGDKSGGGAASRHPEFRLWLINRSATVTPAKLQATLGGPGMMAMQSAIPKLVGSNEKIMVVCFECSSEQRKALVSALQLKSLPN
jgi:hypothetical protein